MKMIQLKYFLEFFFVSYIVGFTIFAYFSVENNILYPWLFFIMQVSVCVIQSILVYNQLDNMFPPILYSDNDYKNTKITTKEKIVQYVIWIFMILIALFLIFISVVYVINFSTPSGTYYLQTIQASLFFFVIFYFFNEAFGDFSGTAYCDFYQSQNGKDIKYSLVPRTLTDEMMEIYKKEFYFSET